jgi:acyl-CoA hydrolase
MTQPAKTPNASRVTLAQLMGVTDSNMLGNVHGGHIMKLMDEAGAAAAIRHSGRRVVTVAVDRLLFKEPIRVGHLVTVTAVVTYVGRTSIETQIDVSAENLLTHESTHTNTAYFVYVALDEHGRPAPVPALDCTSAAERARFAAGQQRQATRKASNQ